MNQQLFSFAIFGSVVSGMLNVINDIPIVGEHVQPLLKKLVDVIPLKDTTFGRGMAFSFAYLTPFKMSSVDHVRPVDVLLEEVDWKIHGSKLALINFRAHSMDDTAVLISNAGKVCRNRSVGYLSSPENVLREPMDAVFEQVLGLLAIFFSREYIH
mmetsp:Transcript_33400/g.131722  ORF Transcript_33400/g.131722 Transcript_33400/m.131722 type:complete len:156 (+) Transcript_33400:1244-1711(+)